MVNKKNVKAVSKDTSLETVAIAAIPAGIGLISADQLLSGVAVAVIGIAALALKYNMRD